MLFDSDGVAKQVTKYESLNMMSESNCFYIFIGDKGIAQERRHLVKIAGCGLSLKEMAMPRLRHTHSQESTITVPNRPLRILASGTVFLTHTLALPTQPSPFTVTRAHSVVRTRGGSAGCLLSVLVQFNSTQGNTIEGQLIAALGGDEEGKMIIRELENEGVGLRYCKIWKGAGVPSAWVLKSGALTALYDLECIVTIDAQLIRMSAR